MSKLKRWLIAITIPTLIFLTFYYFYSNKTVAPQKKTCTYLSTNTCVVNNIAEGTIKNIDLNRYNVNSSTYKVGEQVTYKVISESSQRTKTLLIVFVLCFFLIFFIRFPFLLYIFAIGM